MNIKIQIIVIAITLLAMLYIINKIRIKEIELRYSLLWLFFSNRNYRFCILSSD